MSRIVRHLLAAAVVALPLVAQAQQPVAIRLAATANGAAVACGKPMPAIGTTTAATLPDVIRHYEAGGRTVTDGPYRGVGADNPHKSEFVTGFTLTDQERADLVAFLESLTDLAFTKDPRFASPWPQK